jgi:hypothetical protein
MKSAGKVALVATVVGGSLGLGVGPASAVPPQRLEPEPTLTVEACGTAVTITDVVSKGKVHTRKNSDTIMFTGPIVVEVSTPDGRSVTLNVSGSARVTPTATGYFAQSRGRNLNVAVTAEERRVVAEAGFPTLALTTGPLDVAVAIDPATGFFTALDVQRRPPKVQDVCDLL